MLHRRPALTASRRAGRSHEKEHGPREAAVGAGIFPEATAGSAHIYMYKPGRPYHPSFIIDYPSSIITYIIVQEWLHASLSPSGDSASAPLPPPLPLPGRFYHTMSCPGEAVDGACGPCTNTYIQREAVDARGSRVQMKTQSRPRDEYPGVGAGILPMASTRGKKGG
jgi:hypothetical protein